jgi:hypothetical protein
MLACRKRLKSQTRKRNAGNESCEELLLGDLQFLLPSEPEYRNHPETYASVVLFLSFILSSESRIS